jgi:hypothetical protein
MNIETAREMWDKYVGQQGAREFLAMGPSQDVRESVDEYLAHLDEMFGAGTSEEAPSNLAESLIAYIEHEMEE